MLILCLQDVILVLFGHVGQFILQVNVEKVWKSEKDEDNYTSTSPGEFYCLIYSIVEIAVLEGKYKVVRVR